MDADRRSFLLELRARDDAKRQELIARGELHLGYHPEMERVHSDNARALSKLLDDRGWPVESDVGADGAEAAFIVAHHAIGEPAFQRRCLVLLDAAVEARRASPVLAAMLTDRIRYNERRPQLYGTILDWDEQGELSPWHLERPDDVESLRSQVGLPPLETSVRQVRDRTRAEGGRAPKPHAERQAEILQWARRCGWIAS